MSDAELLETLLAKVLGLSAAHRDDSADGHAGLPIAEAALLIELLDGGDVTQQQLADRLDLDKSRISRLCSALEDKRLLVRERDRTNRRNLLLHLTPAGEAAARSLRRTMREQHERILSAMSPEERESLLLGLGALARELGVLHGHRKRP
jgi:DNA-binding MarR family transcriptional regulator